MRRPSDLLKDFRSIPRSHCGFELAPRVQEILAALADVEAEYEIACERLDAWLAPAAVKERIKATLLQRRYSRRAPLEGCLRDMQRQLFQSTVLH